MKNFKLLLATTAILSTGLVVGALADGYNTGETENFKVYVDFVNGLELDHDEDLAFGTVINPVAGETVIVSAWGDEPSGTANYTDAIMPVLPASFVVSGVPANSNPRIILSSNTVWLKNKNNEYCGQASLETNNGADLTCSDGYCSGIKVGGTLTIGAPEGDTMATTGTNCSAQVTATLWLYGY